MSEDNKQLFEGYNSPASMADSMMKRYHQFKTALPDASNDEIFKLILDNRYKLLGNLVPLSERQQNIINSHGSISLLTFNTIISENRMLPNLLLSNIDELQHIMKDIFNVVVENSKSYTENEFGSLVIKAREILEEPFRS